MTPSLVTHVVWTMRLKGIFVACCLLVFLAVVHGEAGHDETEHVDDDQEYELDRERREAGDTETNVDGPAVEKGEGEVTDREKRHRMSTCDSPSA